MAETSRFRPSATGHRMTPYGAMSAQLLVLLLVAATLPLGLVTASTYSCPSGCVCDDDAINCTSVSGLRNIDKSLPIKRLVLSGLELVKIPSQLENIRNITELDLSNNHLSEVNHLGRRIRRLNLSQNRITSGKLAKIPQFVESLNLTYNEITYLPFSLMKLKKLRYIELANNPINCTCETLNVRNWLTTRHVWSDQHIKCSAPQEFKGRSWLQVRQAEVCQAAAEKTRKDNWDDDEDENDLMLGDQPNVDNGDDELEDEFKKEYMPVGEKLKSNDVPLDIHNDDTIEDGSGDDGALDVKEDDTGHVDDVVQVSAASEGSGGERNESVIHVAQIQSEPDGDDDEGSGSGGGILLYNTHGIGEEEQGTSDEPDTDDGLETVEGSEEKPITSPEGLGIFGKGLEDDTTTFSTTESSRAPFILEGGEKESIIESTEGAIAEEEQRIAEGPVRADSDNQGTYILLAILGILLVSLVIVVICKRKPDARNRRGKNDLESARDRELQDMDKSLLGKPLEKNGHNLPERIPLMNDKSDLDKVLKDKANNYAPVKPERTSLEKPSMESFKPVPADRNKSKESLYENVPQNNNNNGPLPNGNGAVRNGDPAGIHQPSHNVPSQDNGGILPPNGNPHQLQPADSVDSPKIKRYSPIYVPTSPKSDRYSPVYSPETGRVKIKLTETPKPKTPILVTRSRSRAGDYITTPDQKF